MHECNALQSYAEIGGATRNIVFTWTIYLGGFEIEELRLNFVNILQHVLGI